MYYQILNVCNMLDLEKMRKDVVKKQLPFLTTKDFKYNERHKNVHTYLKSQIILEDLNENLT